jgi:two-component system, NtrC family, nitrogen regulation sensor histidine kinase NtrY
MIYNFFNLPLIFRILLFSAINILMGYYVSEGKWSVIILLCLLFIISLSELIVYLNSINRKAAYFFDALRNEDSTLYFPEKIKDKAFREFHTSLNKLNNLITEIKIKNEHNEHFFRQLLKYSSTGIIALDEKGYIDLINDASLKMLGMTSLGHIKLLKQKNAELYKSLNAIKPGPGNTIKLFDGSGLKLLSVKVTLVKFSNKVYTVYSINDIKNELEENELDTWQKLIRVLTHEIMNSVAPITSLSKTIRRIFTSEDKSISTNTINQQNIDQAFEGLKVIEETGQGLMNFVDSYRKLTKIPEPVFKLILVDEWFNKVYLLLKNKMEAEKIEFNLINRYTKKTFTGDEKLLTQVVINILNNAITALEGRKQKKIQISSSSIKNGGLEVKIFDNGKGIISENLEKIFIPFFTTFENGSGIGLSLSRQIMRMHKGTIEVMSVPDRNTTFILKL